jgi:hypothetical protein
VIRPHRRGTVSVSALALALAVGVLFTRAARAQQQTAPVVLLLRPRAAPPHVGEALVRLRGELNAEGFNAQVTETALGDDVRGDLDRLASAVTATAIVAVVAGADPASAELWVLDRVTGKTVVRRVRADPNASTRIAEVLSVRAVELLRASFLELAISAHPNPEPEAAGPPAPVPAAVTRFATEPLAEPDWRWAVEAGGGALMSLGGTGGELVPVARVEHAFGPRFCARVTLSGLGTESRVDTPSGGYVDVSQGLMLAEGVVRFRRGSRLEPIVSLGAGAFRLSAEGHELAPYEALSGVRWAAAADVGVGLRLPLRPRRFEVGIEAHAVMAEPYPVIRFFAEDLAKAGRPSLFASITLLGGI